MRVRIIQPIQKVENNKKKVCAYVRVLTVNEKQGESLENQMQYYENIISNNPDYEFVEVFVDKGITGYTEKRPGFQRMLEVARNNKVDIILTKSISRFARNTAVVLETVRQLKDIGVEVRFEKENINTLSGDGEFMLTVLSSFAQEESKNVSDNLRWRAKKKFEKGELIINAKRFLGYDKDEYGDLVINEEESRIIRRIFSEYISGKGAGLIAKELNKDGILTVGNKRWHTSSILLVLKNEKYKGDALLQKYYTPEHVKKRSFKNNEVIDSYYVEDNHSAIISREMWEQVQEEIKRRAEAKGNVAGDTDKYTNRYPLTGMLYCSKCGSTLRRRTWNSKNSSKKIVWQCGNYINNGKDACTGTSIEDEVISRLNIKEKIIVKESIKDGKKHYIYTCKSKQEQCSGTNTVTEKKNGGLLQSINRPIRTVIKL